MAGITKKSIFICFTSILFSRSLSSKYRFDASPPSICRLYNDYYCLCYALVKTDCRFFIFDDLYRFFDVLYSKIVWLFWQNSPHIRCGELRDGYSLKPFGISSKDLRLLRLRLLPRRGDFAIRWQGKQGQRDLAPLL